MKTKYIDIGDGRWGLIICYDFGLFDYDDMWAIMRSFNMSNKGANEALIILNEPNTGMAVSNYDIRMSVIFISEATSASEWWSTVNHELLHVGTAIIDYYNEDFEGEPAAYLQGYLMKKVVEEIGYPCY